MPQRDPRIRTAASRAGRSRAATRRSQRRRLFPRRARHRRGRTSADSAPSRPPASFVDDHLRRDAQPAVASASSSVAPDGVSYDINVLCVNADSTPRFARDVGPAFFCRRHTAGYWFWEVEQFPDTMRPALRHRRRGLDRDGLHRATRSGRRTPSRSSQFRCPCRCPVLAAPHARSARSSRALHRSSSSSTFSASSSARIRAA